jgi:hypothetical protein
MTEQQEITIQMLKVADASQLGLWEPLRALALKDPARNYFILLGLLNPLKTFEKVITATDQHGDLQAAFYLRRSGNAQFCASKTFSQSRSLAEAVSRVTYLQLIAAEAYVSLLEPFGIVEKVKRGAEIAVLQADEAVRMKAQGDYRIEPLSVQHIEEVIALYRQCFPSFSPKALMEERLNSGRGHGVFLREDGQMAGCAQSEFETPESALIVGVATAPLYRGRGFASACVSALVESLAIPGRSFALQYDNPGAGRIYHRLGFKPVDYVGHYQIRRD